LSFQLLSLRLRASARVSYELVRSPAGLPLAAKYWIIDDGPETDRKGEGAKNNVAENGPRPKTVKGYIHPFLHSSRLSLPFLSDQEDDDCRDSDQAHIEEDRLIDFFCHPYRTSISEPHFHVKEPRSGYLLFIMGIHHLLDQPVSLCPF
jgi:hypothetical protein